MDEEPKGTEAQAPEVKVPASMSEAIAGIRERNVRSSAAPKEKVAEAKDGKKEVPCTECEEAKELREEAAAKKEPQPEGKKPRFFIVDEETGQKVPAVYKSEGKDFTPETIEQLNTWTGLGIHSGERLAKLKGQEAIVGNIVKAMEEGRITIRDANGKIIEMGMLGTSTKTPHNGNRATEEIAPSDEDEDLITDPVVIKLRDRVAGLEKRLGETQQINESLTKVFMSERVQEEERNIRSEIKELSKQYPLAGKREKDVWTLLAKVDEKGTPVYDVKGAMKEVHEDLTKGFREYVAEHPELIDQGKIKKQGVEEYLAEKAKKEEAPVSSPSSKSSPTPSKENESPKSFKESVSRVASFLQSKRGAGANL